MQGDDDYSMHCMKAMTQIESHQEGDDSQI